MSCGTLRRRNAYCRLLQEKGIRKDIEICLYTPEPLPMPVGGPVLGNAVKQIIESKGISYKSQHKLCEAMVLTGN